MNQRGLVEKKRTLENYFDANYKKTCKKLREYSELQKNLWRQIPYLALEANGRGGWSDELSRAYWYGLWNVSSSVEVDLETGKLVYSDLSPAKDHMVFELGGCYINLKAREVVNKIKKIIKEEDYLHEICPDEVKDWLTKGKEEERRECGITKIYTRKIQDKK